MSLGLTNWPLRGGVSRVVVYDPATAGDYATVRLGHVEYTDPEPEFVTLDDGTEDPTRGGRALVVSAYGEAEARKLRAWAAARTAVRAVVVARGRGEHRLWRESVPCNLLKPRPNRPGAFGGVDVRLASHLTAADVTDSSDLLGDLSFTDGGDWAETTGGTATITWGTDADGHVTAALDGGDSGATLTASAVLPLGGVPVALALDVTALSGLLDVTADPLDAAASSLGSVNEPADATGTHEVTTELPAGTWSVALTLAVDAGDSATVRLPALLTRRASGAAIAPTNLVLYGLRLEAGAGTGGADDLLTVYSPSSVSGSEAAGFTLTVPDAAVASTDAAGSPATLYTDD